MRRRGSIWAAVTLVVLLTLPAGATGAGGAELPDLRAEAPDSARIDVVDGRTVLRFSQGIGNVGAGIMQIRRQENPDGPATLYQDLLDSAGAVVHSVPINGSMEWHPEHNHYHLGNVANYELHSGGPDGPQAVASRKISFCFLDIEQLKDYAGPKFSKAYKSCSDPFMGISPGWADVYGYWLYDQWVDVTGLPDGLYYLVVQVDPLAMFIEADDAAPANNRTWVAVELSDNGKKVRILK